MRKLPYTFTKKEINNRINSTFVDLSQDTGGISVTGVRRGMTGEEAGLEDLRFVAADGKFSTVFVCWLDVARGRRTNRRL